MPYVRAALEQTIRPARARQQWEEATPAGRVEQTLATLRQAQNTVALHNWFVALDEAFATDTQHVADWLRAASAVTANLETAPAFASLHRVWQTADRDTVRAQLRGRVEAFLDGAREKAPASEQAWRDLWRVETAAEELCTRGQSLPVYNGLKLTPGLWLTLGAPPTAIPAIKSGKLDEQAFQALYSAWAGPVGAFLARDSERLTQFTSLLPKGPGDPAARVFAQAIVEIETAIGLLTQRKEAAWETLARHHRQVQQHRPWVDAIDHVADAWFEEVEGPEEARLLKAWQKVTASKKARTWQLNREVEGLVEQLVDKKIKEKAALERLAGILKEAPGHALATDLQRRIEFSQWWETVAAHLRRDRVAEAVGIALRSGNQEVRDELGNLLLKILADNVQRMSELQFRQWVNWLHELRPNDPECQELWRRYG